MYYATSTGIGVDTVVYSMEENPELVAKEILQKDLTIELYGEVIERFIEISTALTKTIKTKHEPTKETLKQLLELTREAKQIIG